MINSVGLGIYNAYDNVQNKNIIQTQKQTETQSGVDLQEVLSKLGEYTYQEDDLKDVNKEVVAGLKDKFNLTEEEIGKLRKNGFNLENLLIEDTSSLLSAQTASYSSASVQEQDEEESKQEDKKEEEGKKNLASTSQKVSKILEKNDSMYLHALNSTEGITINSLYESNFKGDFKKVCSNFSKEDVLGVLQMNGLQNTEGNIWAANKLLEYGMNVDSKSVTKLQNIDAALKTLEESEENVDEDKLLMSGSALNYESKDVVRMTDELGMVTDEYIESLLQGGEEINIGNLRESIHKNTQAALEETASVPEAGKLPDTAQIQQAAQTEPGQNKEQENGGAEGQEGGQKQLSREVQNVKDQINQIRAKLTAEAAQKISEKMPLESSQLSEIVKELNALENQAAIDAANAVQLEATEENIESIKQVISAVSDMKYYMGQTVQIELETNGEATVQEVQKALGAYSENELTPEARFGESIKSIEEQISKVLEEQGIEVTDETVQAAKALITSNMEINSENMQEVLEITQKVNTFLEEMTPTQAASLIKEGLNPYNASIDTILEWISDEKIEDLKDNVAESIVALQEKGQINDVQKESLIGLYRILNAVDQNKEEVIGYLYKNNLTLTTEHLQEAAKYIKSKNHISTVVDDSTGELQSLENQKETAKQKLEASKKESSKTLEIIRQLEKMELPISEENVEKLQKVNAILYPYIKEQFKKEMGKFDGMSTLPQNFLDKLEYIKNVDSETVQSMINQEIPLTVSNIYWTDRLIKEPDLYSQLLSQNDELEEDLPENLEDIEEKLNELEKKTEQEKETAIDSGDILKYRNAKQMQEMVSMQKQLIEKEGLYQIPFVINGETRMVNLYVDKDTTSSLDESGELKAMISYETKNIGTVKAFIQMKDDRIGYKVQGETAEITNALQQNDEFLQSLLEGIGYNVGYKQFVSEAKAEDETIINPVKHDDSTFEEVV